jgi:hypothetical protein
MTREHAWPNWLRQLFPSEQHTLTFAPLNRPERQWIPAATSMGVTVKDSCIDCNTGWMSRMEQETASVLAPLVTGTAKGSLNPDQLLKLAAWCYKTVLVFDLVTTHEQGPYFSSQDRLALCQTGCPPNDGLSMWVGAFVGANVATCVDYRFFYDRSGRSEGLGEGYISTISIGQFVFQALAVRTLDEFRRVKLPQSGWDDATYGVWPAPSETEIRWPPKLSMTNEGLSLFIDRFKPKTPIT